MKKVEDELSDFKINPEKYVVKENDNLLLNLYGLLSIALALFLFVFYYSVIYSALFREISITKHTLFDSIFYPRAYEDAFNKGLASFALVVLGPFIFIALGIIVELYNNKKKANRLIRFILVYCYLLFC